MRVFAALVMVAGHALAAKVKFVRVWNATGITPVTEDMNLVLEGDSWRRRPRQTGWPALDHVNAQKRADPLENHHLKRRGWPSVLHTQHGPFEISTCSRVCGRSCVRGCQRRMRGQTMTKRPQPTVGFPAEAHWDAQNGLPEPLHTCAVGCFNTCMPMCVNYVRRLIWRYRRMRRIRRRAKKRLRPNTVVLNADEAPCDPDDTECQERAADTIDAVGEFSDTYSASIEKNGTAVDDLISEGQEEEKEREKVAEDLKAFYANGGGFDEEARRFQEEMAKRP